MNGLAVGLAAGLAYLVGSVSFAVVVSRLFRLPDPRSFGSGNPGATNVLRTGSRPAAALTLFGDAAKGWVAVVLAQWASGAYGLGTMVVAAAAIAVFLGHVFPVFFAFKGGKGVSTALGILLALDARLGLACLVTWIAVLVVGRISSLAALAAAVSAPLWAWMLAGPGMLPATCIVLAALVAWRHEGNIRRLMSGSEPRIGRAG